MTDQERIDEALTRAADILARLKAPMEPLSKTERWLKGWADAIQSLRSHDCMGTIALDSDTIEGCSGCNFIRTFCETMLGEGAKRPSGT